MDLIGVIAEMREWRYGDDPPPYLPPIGKSALELGLHLGLIDAHPKRQPSGAYDP